MMNLRKYDGRLVSITDTCGEIFEGTAEYLVRDYCMHEFGRDEDSLQIANILFFKDDIKRIKKIDSFSSPYGRAEIVNFEDGADVIDDILSGDNDEFRVRLIRCIEDRLTKQNPDYNAIMSIVHSLAAGAENGEIKAVALRIEQKQSIT